MSKKKMVDEALRRAIEQEEWDYRQIVEWQTAQKWFMVGVGAFILAVWLSQYGEYGITRVVAYITLILSVVLISVYGYNLAKRCEYGN